MDACVLFRFNYFWPLKYQKLISDKGIIPSIYQNKWLIIQIPFLFFFQFINLIYLCFRLHPDYIYSHWFTPQGLTGQIASSIMNIPHVLTSHSSDVEVWKKIPLIGKKVVQIILPQTKATTVVSKRSYKKMRSFFPSSDTALDTVKIIPMGINCPVLDDNPLILEKLKKKYGFSRKQILLFIGRLTHKKGVMFLLKAFREIHEHYSDLIILIAGSGNEEEKLKKEAIRLGIQDKIYFLGFVTGKKKEELFYITDFVVIPSIIAKNGDAEGLPVALLESLSFGKITIATDVSGADDVLKNGSNGFIIKSESVDEIVKAIDKVLNLSRVTASDIKHNARKTAEKYDWNVISPLYFHHFFY